MSKTPSRMSRVLVLLACGGVAVGAPACGSSGKGNSYPDASTSGSGGATAGGQAGAGGSAGHAGTASGGSGGTIVFPGSGGTGTPAGGTTGHVGTPPAPGSTAVLPGTALLIGPGAACSSAPVTTTPAPDRWCGVFVPSGNQMVGLLVFNLTKALAGTPITCDATDVNCVPLNASVDVNKDDTDATYGFVGQTLLYYDATTVYAWRPGWTAGRAIMAHSTTQPVQCAGAPNDAATAICLAGTTNNLYAGTLDTATGGMLPLVEALTNGSTGIDFSPDGLSVIWSVKTSTSATNPAETLKVQTIGDATSKKTIASNITQWAVSADATRWYWLSAPTTDANMITTGALQTAPYPAGAAPTAIQAKVGQYLLYGTKSAITLTTAAATTAPGADMNVIPDVDVPAPALVEGLDVIGLVGVTGAGNILYATMAAQPSSSSSSILVDLRLINTDGTGKCAVAATASADPGAGFNAAGTAVEWVDVKVDASGTVTSISGDYTTVADCAPHVFSTSLYGFYDVTSGLLFQQNYSSTAFTADIDYAPLGATGVPGAATVVQASADSTIVPLFPAPGRVLFTLSSGSATDGVYLSPVITAATPDLAPVHRSLATTTASRLFPLTTPSTARARFTNGAGAIPSAIAAPAPRSLLRAGSPAALPYGPSPAYAPSPAYGPSPASAPGARSAASWHLFSARAHAPSPR